MATTTMVELKAKDFKGKVDPDWCPGCGDFGLLNSVQKALAELGIDLADARPRKLDEPLAREADLLVTMGCGEECPWVPGLEVLDWEIEDPAGKRPDRVRRIRDEIERRVGALVSGRGWQRG